MLLEDHHVELIPTKMGIDSDAQTHIKWLVRNGCLTQLEQREVKALTPLDVSFYKDHRQKLSTHEYESNYKKPFQRQISQLFKKKFQKLGQPAKIPGHQL